MDLIFIFVTDSFFTERYIPYSEDYLIALQDSDLSMRAGNMESKKYLVIHGTADTEVHPQHSLVLAKSLIQEGVLFRHQVCFFISSNLSIKDFIPEFIPDFNADWCLIIFRGLRPISD